MVGLALATAICLDRLLQRLGSLRWLTPLVVFLVLSPPWMVSKEQEDLLSAQSRTWNALQELKLGEIRLPRGSSVLVRDDPFGGYWDMHFILRLYFRDPSLEVAFWPREDAVPK